MTMTPFARERLTAMWRTLALVAVAGDAAALKAAPALEWASPFAEDKSRSFILFALARLAYGFARAASVDRPRHCAVLKEVAHLALEVLGPETRPPELPFRADLDG